MIIRANKYFVILLLFCACLNNGESKATKQNTSKHPEVEKGPNQHAAGTKDNLEDEQKGITVSVFVPEGRKSEDKEETVGEDLTKMIEGDGDVKGGSVPFRTQSSQRRKREEKVNKQSLKEDERSTQPSMTTNNAIIAKKEQRKAVEEEETTQGPTITVKVEPTQTIEEEEATEVPVTIIREEQEQDQHLEDAKTTNKKDKLGSEIEDEKRSPKQNQKTAQVSTNTKVVQEKEDTEKPMNITRQEQKQEQHFEDTEKSSEEETSPVDASNSTGEETTKQAEAISTTENEETKMQSDNLKTELSSAPTIFLKQKQAKQSGTTSANFIKTEVTGANEKTDEDTSPTPSTDLQEEKAASLSPRASISRSNDKNSRHHHESLNSSDEGDEDYPKSFEHVSLEVEEHARKIVEAAAFDEPKSGALGLTAKISISFVLACIAFCL